MTATVVSIAAVVVVIFVLLYTGTMNRRAREAWQSVEGVVVESRVEARNDPGVERPNVRYGARVLYEYSVGGTTYRENRVRFGGAVWRADRQAAEADAAKYPAGAKVTVYYNPASPQNAVLEIAGQ